MRTEMDAEWGSQDGAVIVIVVLALTVLLGFTALTIDIGHLYVVKNQLQNAADAGALAGARVLYKSDGTLDRAAVIQSSIKVGTENNSEDVAVEVQSSDVEIGHWSFAGAANGFTVSSSDASYDWNTKSFSELDADTTFVNAVRVTARRQSIPAASFFAKIFGFQNFTVSASAVAYLGFAGTLNPEEVDQPLAICLQSIVDSSGNYTCNTGRMLNSGGNAATSNTAAWTNFSQLPACDSTNTSSLRTLTCGSGNPNPIAFGEPLSTNGGVLDSTIRDLRNCFDPNTRTEPWNMELPVINCPGNNPVNSNCQNIDVDVVGVVDISVVWISGNQSDPSKDGFPPSRMGDWSCPSVCSGNASCCWDSSGSPGRYDDFVSHFHLQDVNNQPATYADKSIYFLPTCDYHEPQGRSGGGNFGVLAKIPALVN